MKQNVMIIKKLHQAKFLLSVLRLKYCPADQGVEVAFIGRSNAGKSSALNVFTQQKRLARISKTPGRTQMINFFQLGDDENLRLVDLPGYGYAKVPKTVKDRWQRSLGEYLAERQSLAGLVLLMDVRHPMKPQDQDVLHWASSCDIPIHILLTKSDKLKRGPAKQTLLSVQKDLQAYGENVSIQLFSAVDKTGLDEAYQRLADWML